MGVFDNAKKVPTGVCGLDSLFYDGLQLQNFNEQDSSSENKSRNKEKGLIIMLKGVRGINKMHLAMQMLHGISRSIYSIPGLSKYASVPYFFSLNKTKEDLSDFFLDYLITRQIDIIIRKSASGEDASQWIDAQNNVYRMQITRSIFRKTTGIVWTNIYVTGLYIIIIVQMPFIFLGIMRVMMMITFYFTALVMTLRIIGEKARTI